MIPGYFPSGKCNNFLSLTPKSLKILLVKFFISESNS